MHLDAPLAGAGSLTAPARRLGMLVPASNTNAEPLTAAVFRDVPGVELFVTRFQLPASLSAVIDLEVLGESVDLIGAVRPDVVAFHGTAGSWTGMDHDAQLAVALAERTGARVGTTATQAMLTALRAIRANSIAVVFPGTSGIVDGIAAELGKQHIKVRGRSTLSSDLSNPQIAALPMSDVRDLLLGADTAGAEAVLCVGTNLRAGYLVDELEQALGLPIIDSALAVAWHLLRSAGIREHVPGWGSLLRDH